MSYKSFDASTMIAISDPWVDVVKDRPLLEACPVTAGIVPVIADAHNEVLRMLVASDDVDEKARALTEKVQAFDGVHDDKYRSLYSLFTAMAAVSEAPRRAALEEARDLLMPEGMLGVQRSFLAEAANVEVARKRLTPQIRTLLLETVVGARTMLDLFNDLVAAGRELGEAERERARFAESSAASRVSARDLQQARYRWIRTVNALTALLELDYDFSEALRTRILQPLRAAEAKQTGKKTPIVEETDTPADTPESDNANAV